MNLKIRATLSWVVHRFPHRYGSRNVDALYAEPVEPVAEKGVVEDLPERFQTRGDAPGTSWGPAPG